MSLKIGRFFGINLQIHWSFWLLPLWVVFTSGGGPDGESLPLHLAVLAAAFGCVVLHEYGHALTARLFGIATRDITLYPIGGVARLERMSEQPLEEFCIAIAGPLVNVAIAVLLILGLSASAVANPAFLRGAAGELLVLLAWLNIWLFLFNMLPGFPMDGGRILRALLSMPLGHVPATRVAVFVSFGMAVVLGPAAMFFWHTPWPMLIGLFLILAGQQELLALEMRERQRQEEAAPRSSPDAEMPPSHGMPTGHVTVYVWDVRKHCWIPQGVIPARPFTHRSGWPV
jgi:Zn-dependent protease